MILPFFDHQISNLILNFHFPQRNILFRMRYFADSGNYKFAAILAFTGKVAKTRRVGLSTSMTLLNR
jgi:hypothetical protein